MQLIIFQKADLWRPVLSEDTPWLAPENFNSIIIIIITLIIYNTVIIIILLLLV